MADSERFVWWALRRSKHGLPVLFETKADAIENADSDEAVYKVAVINCKLVRESQDAREK